MIPVPHDTGSHLTTSRISRLLRPLRTKCTYFAAHADAAKPRGGVAITYASSTRHGSRRSNADEDPPPLAVIAPPTKLSSLSGSDRPTRDALQLSKAVYDIRDAFKNVIQVAFGAPSGSGAVEQPPPSGAARVRSLASICASVIGDHIEDQVRFHDEEDEAEDEDEEALEILNELYDAVPPHYRRYTVVAHALSLVLDACPRHPSLLYLLLEATLFHNLQSESHTLLRQLLDLAFRPQPASFSPRVKHPAHLYYLTSLLDMCVKGSGGTPSVINDRAFARAVVDVLVAAPDPMAVDAWTCRAVARLARRVLSQDFSAWTLFPASLAAQIAERRNLDAANASRMLLQDSRTHEDNRLTKRLTGWLDATCRHVYSRHADLVADNDGSAALMDILRQATRVEFKQPPDESDVNPADLVVCLCTLFLSTPALAVSNRDIAQTVDFLRRTPSGTSTYTTLLLLSLPSKSMEDYIQSLSDAPYWTAFAVVDRWTKSLRTRGCYLHEASLWSSFLSHVEHLTPEAGSRQIPLSSTRRLEQLRSKIIVCVEDAERRTFGGASVSSTPLRLPAYTPRKGPAAAKSGQWRWEDTFDCWVAKTPATAQAAAATRQKRARSVEETCSPVKRRRLMDAPHDEFASPLQQRRRRALDDSAVRGRQAHRAPSPRSSRTSASLSPTPPTRSKRVAHLPLPDGGDDEEKGESDEDCVPIRPLAWREGPIAGKGPGRLDRRQTISFQTVVADALRNKVVLHRHPRRHSDYPMQRGPPSPVVEAQHLSSDADGDEESDFEERDDGVCTADQLSSDDALDLFAYMSSEC